MGVTRPPRGGAARRRQLAGSLALALFLAWLGRGAGPASAQIPDEEDLPDFYEIYGDSAVADSMRQAYVDSVAVADSLAELGFDDEFFAEEDDIDTGPSLLGGRVPDHSLTYNTTYSVLRNRKTWRQEANFYRIVKGIEVANRTSVTLAEDPDVRRETRNRSTEIELGYRFFPALTSGVRLQVARNSDVIGIRQQNSIERDQDQISAFLKYAEDVGGIPITLDATFGGVSEDQPEFSRRGTDFDVDLTASRQLAPGLSLNTTGNLSASWLDSRTPSSEGLTETSDRSNERRGRIGLNWSPAPWLGVDVGGTSRRGTLQRPGEIEVFDEDTFDFREIVVSEEVLTQSDNGDLALRLRFPWGTQLTTTGRISDTEILFSADSSRSNVSQGKNFNLTASDSLLGANVRFNFSAGNSESDYTRRDDGYLQIQDQRRAELRADRRLNPRTTARLTGGVTLTQRRFEDFRPSGPTSFPPADQDRLTGNSALGVDYRPAGFFNTGLEGRVDVNRTINLTSTTSINNADQVGYNVVWRWQANPWPFWTVSQNNTAGAQQVTYPFAPSRDQLSIIYQIRTSSTTRLTQTLSVEMHYNLRFQSRGSFEVSEPDRGRVFGKSSGTEQYDLLLRTIYRPTSWLSGEISQQTFLSRNLTEPAGVERIDSETRRRTLTFRISASHTIQGRTALSFNLQRTETEDETRTFNVPGSVPTGRDDQFWQATASARTYFDF